METSISFADLPYDIFYTIVTFLDARELVDMMSVCQLFKQWSFLFLLSNFRDGGYGRGQVRIYVADEEVFLEGVRSLPHPSITTASTDDNEFISLNSVNNTLSDCRMGRHIFSTTNFQVNFSDATYFSQMIKSVIKREGSLFRLDLTRFYAIQELLFKSADLCWQFMVECRVREILFNFQRMQQSMTWTKLSQFVPLSEMQLIHLVDVQGPINAEQLQYCHTLSLEHSHYDSNFFSTIPIILRLPNLKHLHLIHTEFNCLLIDLILRNLQHAPKLMTLEVCTRGASGTCDLILDDEMVSSLESTNIYNLTISCHNLSITKKTSRERLLPFKNIKQLQYFFNDATGGALERLLIPRVDVLDRLLIPNTFNLSMFSHVKYIHQLIYWHSAPSTYDYEIAPGCKVANILVGSRFNGNTIISKNFFSQLVRSVFVITLHNVDLEYSQPIKYATHIKEINFKGCRFDLETILSLLMNSKSLSSIKLDGCSFQYSEIDDLQQRNIILKELKSLTITACSNCSGFINALTNFRFPSLGSLVLEDVEDAPGSSIMTLLCRCSIPFHNFRKFIIKGVKLYDDALVEMFNNVYGSNQLDVTIDFRQVTLPTLLKIPEKYLKRTSTFRLTDIAVDSDTFSSLFSLLDKVSESGLTNLTVCVKDVLCIVPVVNYIAKRGFSLVQLSIIISNRMDVNTNATNNQEIRDALQNMILKVQSLRFMVMDWSPFQAKELEQFKQDLRNCGRSAPKLVFPLSRGADTTSNCVVL